MIVGSDERVMLGAALLLALAWRHSSRARRRRPSARSSPGGSRWRQAIAAAAAGDILRLMPGDYDGPGHARPSRHPRRGRRGDRPGRRQGQRDHGDGPGRRGARRSSCAAPGASLNAMDSGIFLTRDGAPARGSRTTASKAICSASMSTAPQGAVVAGNVDPRPGRHAPFGERQRRLLVERARRRRARQRHRRWCATASSPSPAATTASRATASADLRFAIHFMYTKDSVVAGNVSIGNHTGYAIMFSNNVEITGNRAEASRDHGLMLQSVNGSRIEGNRIVGRRPPRRVGAKAERGRAEMPVRLQRQQQPDRGQPLRRAARSASM